MSPATVGAISLSLAAAIWGGVFVVSRYVMDYVPPLALIWIRYLIAAALLFALIKRAEGKTGAKVRLAPRDWFLVAAIGFVGYFVSIFCQFTGTRMADAHTGALITSTSPVFTVIFAKFFLKEKLGLRKVLSLIVSGLGVVVIVGPGSPLGSYTSGVLVLVVAAITWALLSVLVRMASFRIDSMTITAWAILFAAIFTTPAMLIESASQPLGRIDAIVIAGVLYIGIVSTALAYFLWNKGLEKIDAGRASLFLFIQPVVGALLGWLVLGETLSARFFAGGAMVLAGVFLSIITVGTQSKH